MADQKKKLKAIKSGVWERTFALSKLTIKSGGLATAEALKQFMNLSNSSDKSAYLTKQMSMLTEELGQLKGSLMKGGQLLSTFGEHFLPQEAVNFLKTLQYQSPAVEWSAMAKQLRRELGEEKLNLLEIDEEPLAAASLGQVHLAKIKKTGQEIVLKIQYPDLEKVIEHDLNSLKKILNLLNFLPKDGNYESLFVEVQSMLEQEMDYTLEQDNLNQIHEYLKNDARFVVPKSIPEFSTKSVLAMTYEPGEPTDSPQVKALSQEHRNLLGTAFLELYFRELFDIGKMQTDPHPGNYRVRLRGAEPPQLILYDYGAVKEIPLDFMVNYHRMIMAAYERNERNLVRSAQDLRLLQPNDEITLVNQFVVMCFLFTEPFAKPDWNAVPDGLMSADGAYDYQRSDLPKRVMAKGKDIILSFRLRTPPKDLIFLDRKLAGTFSILSLLGAQINGRSILEPWIRSPAVFKR